MGATPAAFDGARQKNYFAFPNQEDCGTMKRMETGYL